MAAVLQLRRELGEAGPDCGPATIAYHLASKFESVPSRVTIWRLLKRHGLIAAQPQKRPACSRIRFRSRPAQRAVAGQLIRQLTLDPTRDYQPLTAP